MPLSYENRSQVIYLTFFRVVEVRVRDNPRYNLSPIISTSPFKLVGLLVENRFLPLWLDVSTGELKEMLIALFIMMYILSLYNKEKNLTRVQAGECRKSS